MRILRQPLDARAGNTLAVTRPACEPAVLTVFVRAQRLVFPSGRLEGLALDREPSPIFLGYGGLALLLASFCGRKLAWSFRERRFGFTSPSSLAGFFVDGTRRQAKFRNEYDSFPMS